MEWNDRSSVGVADPVDETSFDRRATMKKITKRLVIRHQTVRDLSLREVRGGAVALDTEPCGTSYARGRCAARD